MSCGITEIPPRRAIVSAMRRPETAVIFATTRGIVAPEPSIVLRFTSIRLITDDLDGIMNTSS